jgi:hypothetical protein
MPRLTRWAIRASLLYLLLGFTLGALILIQKGLALHPAIWSLLPAHIEFLIWGWTFQLVLGMGYWILPRFSSPPRHGNPIAAWTALALLNLGIWLVGLTPWLGQAGVYSVAIGRLAQLGAGLAFLYNAWGRVKAPGA